MARFRILSKDGKSVRFEGKPRYIGTYLKPSYLEFSEIASPAPIAWEVGDYVDYPRTGMRYYLYSIPQPSKNARKGSHGRAFTYSNVQLHAATKELEIALFRDLVSNDNNIHFSTSPDVATFEDVYGIARRIQACMDDLYPGRWEIRVADFDSDADAEIIEKISTAKDFAMSGGTCLDALSKIYELWQDIGWMHSYENGKEVITIGYANRRIAENTTDPYVYGKGNGLTAIRKNQTNKDEFATRLYVYGSERNLPARYYNDKDILNAESVDIRNLMLPMDSWGKTDDLPDARKAYLENAEAVAKFGVIPRVHYFDSDDAGADIYPSIKGMTIGTIRKALTDMGQTQYSPSTEIYTNSAEAVDEIRTAINPSDNGIVKEGGNEYKVALVEKMGESVVSANIPVLNAEVPILVDHLYFSSTIPADFTRGEIMIDPSVEWHIEDAGFDKVEVLINIRDNEDVDSSNVNVKEKASVEKSADGSYWIVKPPRVRVDYDSVYEGGFPLYIFVRASGTRLFEDAATIDITFNEGELFIGANEILDKTFHVTLKQIGFDINLQASLGKGKTISMTTGACAGRNFVIDSCYYSEVGDFWALDLKRQKDNTLGMLFPNKDYQIASGDKFVLLDIAMPDVYVNLGMERLLAEGQKLLARASKIQTNYEPSIDAVVMAESGRTLREGMFMEITDEDVVDNGTDYILIDTLNIYEDESAIPTYKVTLRERRKVTYKGTPSATSSTDTESVGDESADVNVDLSDYYTREEVDSKVGDNASRIATLEGFWYDEDGVLTTDKAVRIKNNLVVNGDTASGGEGQDTAAIGTVIGVSVDGVKYTDVVAGILDLTAAFKNVSVDLSDYYTKNEVNALIDKITAGEIDLANYYTKEQIDAKGFLTSSALDDYAKVSWVNEQIAGIDFSNYYTIAEVDKKISDLNIGQYATTEALTSGLSAKQDTISDLATIRSNAKNGATAYGWGNHASAGYALAKSVPTLTAFDALRSEFDALESALNDDVSGKINTWNEIVDFLDEYSGSQDLATILAGINADIAKRVLQTDFDALSATVGNIANTVSGHTTSIGSNASAISVLQGYFSGGIAKNATADAKGNVIDTYYTPLATYNAFVTATNNTLSGKADKATTLAGYGITNAYTKTEVDGKVTTINTSITAVSNRVTTIETWKTELSKYITIVDGNVKISTNLIVSGDTASGGDGEDTAAIGTVTGIKVNGTTYNPTAGIVTIPDYPTSLEWNAISGKPSFATVATSGNYDDLSNKPTIPSLTGYATETWVTGKDYATNSALTSGLSGKVDKVSGKGLSTNDFTAALLTKLNGIASGAQVNVQSDWSATSGDAFIKNKPTSLPASDVYAWAKASTKPAYTTKEVTESGNLYFTNARAVAALTDTLASYATQSWVEGKKYLTSHQEVKNTGNTLSFGSAIIIGSVGGTNLTVALPSVASVKSTLGLGSLAYKSSLVASDIPDLSSKYLSLGGGTVNGDTNIVGLTRLSRYATFPLQVETTDPSAPGVGIRFRQNGTNTIGLYTDFTTDMLYRYSRDLASLHTILDSGNYSSYALPLTGGKIKNGATTAPLNIDSDGASTRIGFYKSGTLMGYFAFGETNVPNFTSTEGGRYSLIHSGNIGSQSVQSAKDALRFKGLASSGDLNTVLAGGGMARTYSKYLTGDFTNAPSGAYYGTVLQLSIAGFAGSDALSGQLAWDINHNSTTDATRYLWWRAADTNGFTNSKWHQIAFTDSNVASATKLATARTIWGQSFDGTGNVTGNLYLGSNILYGGNNYNILDISGGSGLNIGYGIRSVGSTVYWAKSHAFYVGDSHALTINSSGNVTIGSSDLAGTGAKLYVNGNTTINGVLDVNNSVEINSGSLTIVKGQIIRFHNTTDNTFIEALGFRGDSFHIGYGNRSLYDTYVQGNNIVFRPGAGTEAMRLNSSGNIGIGTTSPAYKLDVAGTGRFTGDTLIQGGLSVSSVFSNDGTAGVAGVFLRNEGGIEISHASTPYIDFHYANSTSDFSLRVVARANNILSFVGGYFCPWSSESLGTSSYRWNYVYAKAGSFLHDIEINGALTVGGGATITGNSTINGNLVVTGDVASA